MFERIKRWRDRRRQDAAVQATLARDGFVAYCECRGVLNDSPSEQQEDGTHIYTCACGFSSRFLFGPPAPVRVQAWDQAGRELAGEDSGCEFGGGGGAASTSR